MKNLQAVIAAIALIILSFLLGYCNGKKQHADNTVVKTDTVVTHHTDTVYLTEHKVEYIDRPVPSVTLPNYGVETDDSIRAYTNQAHDSLVKINVVDSVAGKLLSSKITFDYSIPTITNTDSVFVKRTEIRYPLRFYIEGFATTKPPQLPGLGLGMNLSTRKINYSVRYDLLRKEYTGGIGVKIF